MLFMTKCSVVGCAGEAGLPGTARGLCRSHYKRFNRYGDAEVELRKVASWKGQQCWVRSCGRKITANGVCEMHYARVKRKQNRELLKTRSQAYLKRAKIYLTYHIVSALTNQDASRHHDVKMASSEAFGYGDECSEMTQTLPLYHSPCQHK